MLATVILILIINFDQLIGQITNKKFSIYTSAQKDMFFNPCKCECEKEIIRTELIVIAREYSPMKTKPLLAGQNRLGTVALEPKQMGINKRNSFRERRSSLFQNHSVLHNKQKEHGIFPIFSSKQSVSTMAMSENPRTVPIKNSQQVLRVKQYGYGQQVDGRVIKEGNSENDGYDGYDQRRVTMKAYNNAGYVKREVDFDNSLTTKRCRKRQSINVIESKTSLPLIHQIANLHDYESNKQNHLDQSSQNGITSFQSNQNIKFQKVTALMKEEISILRSQLLRLQNDEHSLINEKNINHRFFQEDYAINQKKKQSLKRNCSQRSQQLSQLRRLLVECRNRNV